MNTPPEDMPYDLFISYAHRDNARHQVRELRDELVAGFRAPALRAELLEARSPAKVRTDPEHKALNRSV